MWVTRLCYLLTIALWIKFLDARINALPEVTLEEFVDLIELFGKAEKEYLCKLSFVASTTDTQLCPS